MTHYLAAWSHGIGRGKIRRSRISKSEEEAYVWSQCVDTFVIHANASQRTSISEVATKPSRQSNLADVSHLWSLTT